MAQSQTIKAAVFEGVKASAPFVNMTQIPAPIAGNGDVVVKVLAARVLSYAGEIFNGSRTYPSRLPFVPGSGGVGVIKSIGPGTVHLEVGQLVYIDPTVRARDHPISPAVMLQGLIAVGEAQKMQDVWLNGSWAEEMSVPAENITVIPPSIQAKYKPAQLTSLGNYAVVYGGFHAANFRPGQTVAITGSTGPFGASAVAVALGLGARRVVAAGRNQKQLEEYVAKYGSRVVPVVSTGDEAKDTQLFKEAIGEGFVLDLVFDILPPNAPFTIVRSAIGALRFGGTAVLMGGVQASAEVPYYQMMSNNITLKGNFMYTRDAPTSLIGLADAGLLDLNTIKPKVFKLDDVEEAIEWSANHTTPFESTVIAP
ncbi:hypothetical protein BGZ80_005314 [Entomortierella chlamydospora]|uniref:Alcohol dehydrogenase n=1 Tax=Entomortierella chlamydospora TaxID=101097 RepID=A0A9P6ML09_9FUNG|nr:hypothetical protein BGZ79_002885 [Entomortierella chlamydospora]KAG0006400.1 hypothetical protein BGZ80_005314 [Entomortierella chlamydospora]